MMHSFSGFSVNFSSSADMLQEIRREVKSSGCTRALVVGHNAHFDLNFLNQKFLKIYYSQKI